VATDSPTLLCIDHRPQMLELRKSTLESQGYCVKLASGGYTAIKTLEETSVAAVLLEYKQEGIDAEAVACHIKQRFPSLPIILLSAYCETATQQAGSTVLSVFLVQPCWTLSR
jgi:CheY-like chemotaxis protein